LSLTKVVKLLEDSFGVSLKSRIKFINQEITKIVQSMGGPADVSSEYFRSIRRSMVSRKRKRTPPRAEVEISEQLIRFLGEEPNVLLSKSEAVRRVWSYLKTENLHSANDPHNIKCDTRLKALFGNEKPTIFNLSILLGKHMTPLTSSKPPITAAAAAAALKQRSPPVEGPPAAATGPPSRPQPQPLSQPLHQLQDAKMAPAATATPAPAAIAQFAPKLPISSHQQQQHQRQQQQQPPVVVYGVAEPLHSGNSNHNNSLLPVAKTARIPSAGTAVAAAATATASLGAAATMMSIEQASQQSQAQQMLLRLGEAAEKAVRESS
jgi:hypothetical protein